MRSLYDLFTGANSAGSVTNQASHTHSLISSKDPRYNSPDVGAIIYNSISIASMVIGTYMIYKFVSSTLVDNSVNFDKEKKALAKKLLRVDIEDMEFTAHEMMISREVLASEELNVKFGDIGGMETHIEEIMENIILPMKYYKDFRAGQGNLLRCPTGVLLYGKPGTGKSMLAKAIAKEAGTSFINLKSSALLDKYVGESDKLVDALFTLAHKIAPCVVFIDEIDTILKKRESFAGSSSGGAQSSMLGSLMAAWDGLATNSTPVLVLGATNRPMDIDPAFLRRMPLKIKTTEPDAISRCEILSKMLRNEVLDADVSLESIAKVTEGCTGSDLKELCRLAGTHRMKRIIASVKQLQAEGAVHGINKPSSTNEATSVIALPSIPQEVLASEPLRRGDFEYAIARNNASSTGADVYSSNIAEKEAENTMKTLRRALMAEAEASGPTL